VLRCILIGVLALASVVYAQRHVDPRNSYYRVICAVPLVGSGSPADPRRPKYAPWPVTQDQNSIVAFYFELSDDGKSAVVEFVSPNRAAFQPLFNDTSITLFEKGRAAKSDIEAALQRFRRDFDLDKFGMVMPAGSLSGALPISTSYQYYLTDSFANLDTSKWTVTGNVVPSRGGLTAPDPNGGSVISKVPIPDGSSEGEVLANVALGASGGAYTLYLQGSADARSGGTGSGTYLAFEMQNPIFTGTQCSADFAILQSQAGSVSLLGSFAHSCRNGMAIRMAVHSGVLLVWPDQGTPLEFLLNAPASGAGQPGVGAHATPAGNAISQVQVGAANRTLPAALDSRSIGVSAFRRRVDVQWKAVPENATGNGLTGYWIYRDGNYLMRTTNTSFSDEAVSPGDKHTYTIYAVDQHYNFSAGASVNATVPAAVKGNVGAPPLPTPIKK